MFLSFFSDLNEKLFLKYTEKVKPIILEKAYIEKIKYGMDRHYIYSLKDSSEFSPYMKLNPLIIDTALSQLENDNKIVITRNETNPFFVLTSETFNYLSNNRHPVKKWFLRNIFNIFNLIIALWGAITGTIALFFK